MIKCPKPFDDDDRWIALSLLSLIIKGDAKVQTREIDFFRETVSETFGLDASDLGYFDELLNRPINPGDFDKIDIPKEKIIAKHILKEALRLSLLDGDYSEEEQKIIKDWALKNDLGATFVEDLETYIKQMIRADELSEELKARLDELGEDLLNTEALSTKTHTSFRQFK